MLGEYGECGTIGIFLDGKNYLMNSAEFVGALSLRKNHEFDFQVSDFLRRIFRVNLVKI